MVSDNAAQLYNMNNPFTENLSAWNTEDVAGTKVYDKIRRELRKVEFKLAHPPLMYSNDQRRAWRRRLEGDITYWTTILSKAQYN